MIHKLNCQEISHTLNKDNFYPKSVKAKEKWAYFDKLLFFYKIYENCYPQSKQWLSLHQTTTFKSYTFKNGNIIGIESDEIV